MAKGIALAIGLNSVDPAHYAGWNGELLACEADALDMVDIAKSKKFKSSKLLTQKATRMSVINDITKAAKALKPGDIFMLSYSGHGGQVPDEHGDEPDHEDETWCLFDGQLIDDELNDLFSRFAPGVRILVFSDSCHSGTAVRMAGYNGIAPVPAEAKAAGTGRPRCMTAKQAIAVYNKNRAFYKALSANPKLKDAAKRVKASVLLISGCQDNQTSADGDFNGLFTGTMKSVWNKGAFDKDYRAFHRAIVDLMPKKQRPNYFLSGAPSPAFEAQLPFTV